MRRVNTIGGKLAVAWLGVIVFLALFAPFLPFHDPKQPFLNALGLGPTIRGCFGIESSIIEQEEVFNEEDSTSDTLLDEDVTTETYADVTDTTAVEDFPTETYADVTDTTAVEDFPTETYADVTDTTAVIDESGDDNGAAEEGSFGAGTPHGCHLLGTTPDGYDILSLLANGARISMFVAVFSVGIGGTIGGIVGIFAAFRKGVIDRIIVLLFNVILSIPLLVMALAFMAVLAPDAVDGGRSSFSSAFVLMTSLALVVIPQLGRIARSSAMQWVNRDFVTASRSLGATNRSVLFQRIIPNVVPSMLAVAFLAVGVVIVAEGSLALLGAGIPGGVSWGSMLALYRTELEIRPYIVLAPIAVIALTVISTNKVGDIIRQSLDQRESRI
ncbi:MAG: ABC transporter permease [Ilumatobacteraceae bacterium]|nr:ABC transporter permease [Ilumatobacteraceae bacterium]